MAKRLRLQKFLSPCENSAKFATKFGNARFDAKILALRNFATLAKFLAIFLLSSEPLCPEILTQAYKLKHIKIHKNSRKMKNKLQLRLS